jgi:glycosyltransferase involved in cell wall biosynthesis
MQILTTAGHEVAVDVMAVGPTENHTIVKPIKHNIGQLSAWLYRVGIARNTTLHNFPQIRAYWRHMRRLDPDVVIVRGVTRWFCRLAALCALLQRRKLVVYDQEDVTPRPWTGTWIRRTTLSAVGIPHFTSRVEEHAQRASSFGRAISLPFGCGFHETTVRQWGTRTLHWPPRLLMVAKYRDHKGHANLLAALGAIKSEIPFTITFCGEEASDADAQFRSSLQARAGDLGVAERVSFLSNIPHNEMDKIFSTHDLFILPSLNEPAAVSPIEAGWAGSAVLLSRDSGTRGYFPAGSNYDFDAESTEDITRALRRVLAGPKELTVARDRCRKYLEKVSNRESILDTFEKFLK